MSIKIHIEAVTRQANAELARTNKQIKGLQKTAQGTSSRFGAVSASMRRIGGNLTKFVSLPVAAAGVAAVKAAAGFERQRTELEILTGSAEAGAMMFERLKEFAAATPLSMSDIQTATQNLLAFGVSSEDIIPTLQMLGDVSRGNNAILQRVAFNFGQIKTTGKAMSRDLREFATAGIPIYKELAAVMGVSQEELDGLVSAGQVGSEEVIEAFENMTGEGGMFEDMMLRASETTEGKFSTALDALVIAGGELGAALLPSVNKAIEAVTRLAEWFGNLSPEAQKSIIIMGTIAVVLPPVIAGLGNLTTAINGVQDAMKVLATGSTGLAIAAIGGLIIAFTTLIPLMQKARKEAEKREQVFADAKEYEKNNSLAKDIAAARAEITDYDKIPDAVAKAGAEQARSFVKGFQQEFSESSDIEADVQKKADSISLVIRKAQNEINAQAQKAAEGSAPSVFAPETITRTQTLVESTNQAGYTSSYIQNEVEIIESTRFDQEVWKSTKESFDAAFASLVKGKAQLEALTIVLDEAAQAKREENQAFLDSAYAETPTGELVAELAEIEAVMQRVNAIKWGPHNTEKVAVVVEDLKTRAAELQVEIAQFGTAFSGISLSDLLDTSDLGAQQQALQMLSAQIDVVSDAIDRGTLSQEEQVIASSALLDLEQERLAVQNSIVQKQAEQLALQGNMAEAVALVTAAQKNQGGISVQQGVQLREQWDSMHTSRREQIAEQASLFRAAGVEEVAVAKWEKQESIKAGAEKAAGVLQYAQQGFTAFQGMMGELSTLLAQQGQAEINIIAGKISKTEEEYDEKIRLAAEAGDSTVQLELDKDAKLKELETQKQEKELELKKRQFEIDKGMKIASAIMNTALAVTNAIATGGPVAGPILAGFISAMGLVQIGIIAGQQFPGLASGGIVPAQGEFGGLYRLGDKGKTETVIPFDIRDMQGSGMVIQVHIHDPQIYGSDGVEDFARSIAGYVDNEIGKSNDEGRYQ